MWWFAPVIGVVAARRLACDGGVRGDGDCLVLLGLDRRCAGPGGPLEVPAARITGKGSDLWFVLGRARSGPGADQSKCFR